MSCRRCHVFYSIRMWTLFAREARLIECEAERILNGTTFELTFQPYSLRRRLPRSQRLRNQKPKNQRRSLLRRSHLRRSHLRRKHLRRSQLRLPRAVRRRKKEIQKLQSVQELPSTSSLMHSAKSSRSLTLKSRVLFTVPRYASL